MTLHEANQDYLAAQKAKNRADELREDLSNMEMRVLRERHTINLQYIHNNHKSEEE